METNMRMLNRCFTLLSVFTLGLASTVAASTSSTTVENLQAAFNGESNAHARYMAFAQKADRERYGEVASLFRAAARAEEIHAGNHAAVIRTLGAQPHAKLEKPVVKSTRENLETAIKGESYERDTMYPEFITEARAAGLQEAVNTFSEARTAEAEHAKLFAEALDTLPQLKGSKLKSFYVCTVCGYTTAKLDFESCPSCFSAKEKFHKLS
jgi:rubrerythrin